MQPLRFAGTRNLWGAGVLGDKSGQQPAQYEEGMAKAAAGLLHTLGRKEDAAPK